MNVPVDDPGGGNSIPQAEWEKIQARVPIACSDVVPVLLNVHGGVDRVGLILRDSPFGGPRWCHLGGRIRHNESAHEAALRHLRDTLTSIGPDRVEAGSIAADPRAVFEFFTDERPGFGHDPRQHALSLCFQAECIQGVVTTDDGEGREFAWFAPDRLPDDETLWPGTRELVERTIASHGDAIHLGYGALQARALSHDEMTWQTPTLAMTAQAFLMTIAIGPDSSQTARLIASLLSALVSLLSIQLMAKHSALQKLDVIAMEELEQRWGLLRVHKEPKPLGGLAGRRSRVWWQRGTAAFGVVSLLIAVAAVIRPEIFG